MIWEWIKKHGALLVTILVTTGVLFFIYACEPKVSSLWNDGTKINRQELQFELAQFVGLAQLRMADLDKQEQLRAVILQNALILVQGQPFNPVGLITGIAAIYGITSGIKSGTQVVNNMKVKRKVNNGTI